MDDDFLEYLFVTDQLDDALGIKKENDDEDEEEEDSEDEEDE